MSTVAKIKKKKLLPEKKKSPKDLHSPLSILKLNPQAMGYFSYSSPQIGSGSPGCNIQLLSWLRLN